MSQLKADIIYMRSQGATYDEIVKKLGCSKGTISYHCGAGQKEKANKRRRKNRNNQHPFLRKIELFCYSSKKNKNKTPTCSTRKLIQLKIEGFCRMSRYEYQAPNFTIEDVLNKIGENPVCYLTGEPIDINQPRTYSFDHIIPRSRGGTNDIDNLGLCTAAANQAKFNMTPEEFFMLCKKVVDYNT